jgi:hypothetical protein
MKRTEYCIKHQGYFIQEGDRDGLYYRVNDINKATLFNDLDNMLRYIEDDMKLNIQNVQVIKLITSTTESVVEL